ALGEPFTALAGPAGCPCQAGSGRVGPGIGVSFRGSTLVVNVVRDGVNQVGDQVVPALQIDIDLRPGFLGPVAGSDQPVVGENQPQDDQDDDRKDYPGAHALTPRRVRAEPNGSSSAFSCACACASFCAAS